MENQNQDNNEFDRRKLIINYIPHSVTEKDLAKLFVPIGHVEKIKIMADSYGNSYGFGFVNYSNADEASKAIETMNGHQLLDKKLKVSYSRAPGTDRRDTNLYITNLPTTITNQELDDVFGKYGTIIQKNIVKDKISGNPKGVAFVRFAKREEAQNAIKNLDGTTLPTCSSPMTVRVADFYGKHKVNYVKDLEDRENYKDTTLYVSNLPKDINEFEIRDLFAEYGEIVQIKILMSKNNGTPSGVAFVRYAYADEAQYAIDYLDGVTLRNFPVPLNVRIADISGKRKPPNSQKQNAEDPQEVLIEAIYNRRPLWDFSLPPSERSDIILENLWQQIANEFNYEYNIDFLIKKWEELKQAYREQRHKLLAFGDSSETPPITFSYYDLMKFLHGEPTILQRNAQKHKLNYSGDENYSKMRRMVPAPESLDDDVDIFLRSIARPLRNMSEIGRTKVKLQIKQLFEDELGSSSGLK